MCEFFVFFHRFLVEGKSEVMEEGNLLTFLKREIGVLPLGGYLLTPKKPENCAKGNISHYSYAMRGITTKKENHCTSYTSDTSVNFLCSS